jgi:hypothetical protein
VKVVVIDPSEFNCGYTVVEDGEVKLLGTMTTDKLLPLLGIIGRGADVFVLERPAAGWGAHKDTYASWKMLYVKIDSDFPTSEVLGIGPGNWKPWAKAQGWTTAAWRNEHKAVTQHEHDALMLYYYWEKFHG